MRARSVAASISLIAAISGCSGAEPGDHRVVDGPEPVARATAALGGGTVQDAVNAGGCSTLVVHGLSVQIVDEVNCLVPNALAAIPNAPNLTKSATTFGYMQTPAQAAFTKMLATNQGMSMSVDSMLRTVAQQYLLYAWYLAGMCGIQLAATPGTSNHEQGLAFDTPDYNQWMSAAMGNDFMWYGNSDVVHFDYVGPGAVDLNGKDVLAFQKLWNINNPNDMISEDGSYGPATESRLKQSPADGFPTGAPCNQPPPQDGGSGTDSGAGGDAGQAPPGDGGGPTMSPDGGGGGSGGGGPPTGDGGSAHSNQASTSSSGGCSTAPGRSDWQESALVAALGGLVLTRLRRRPVRRA